MNNKKGISALIETVLLILLVLAAAGIIVGVVLPMLRGPLEKAQICVDAMEISSVTDSSVTVTLKKDVAINGIALNIYNATAVNSTSNTDTMSVGEAKTFPLPTGIESPTKVTVVPIITIKGKTETCPAIEALL